MQCADTQCDVLQGGAKVDPAMVRKTRRVIEATWGQVLWYDGRVCDARFSKCCGGALEEFRFCWEDKEVPYLKYARDYESVLPGGKRAPDGLLVAAGGESALAHPDLRDEQAARRWIASNPRAFCNTRSKRLLGQVLKDYDSETKDFYRWKVEYGAEELRRIILERTGEDYGEILDLIPLERGVSGRICRLKIVGSKKTKIIGKELEIRKTLSRSHLYSSAFVVEKIRDTGRSHNECLGRNCGIQLDAGAQNPDIQEVANCYPHVQEGGNIAEFAESQADALQAVRPGIPARFVLRGAGWGHGVGLCQIGAAAMGARGYKYQEILQHYYPNAEIRSLYSLPRGQRESDGGVFVSVNQQKTDKKLSRRQAVISDGVFASHNKDK